MARIGLKSLAALCRRLSTSLGAGVDARKVWAREAERASGREKQRIAYVAERVAQGSTAAEAIDDCGEFFPELFRSMVHVGEKSGHMAEILREMAEQYDHRLQLRRTFISAIWWPLFQLGMSIGVIGLLILIMGMLPQKIDILGFGLVGTSGLVKYLLIVGGVGVAVVMIVRAVLRGALWIRPVQRLILRVPKLGRAFETLALSRLAWTLHVTQGAGMDLRESLNLSLASTRNANYADTADAVWQEIRGGSDLHAAFDNTASYPRDFLDTIEVGEQSGRLVESLGRLSEQYEEEARSAMEIITRVLGFLVRALIAVIIIAMIFRLFSFYVGMINDAAKGI